jgi:UDP-glucose 4-epimerase
MRVLAVGGNGFIGSHVVDALVAAGVDVSVLDVADERYRAPLPDVRYIRGSLADQLTIENALSTGIDVVIHLAGSTLPQTSMDSPVADVQNLLNSITLFQLCATYKVKKVIFISSGGTVYGRAKRLPVSEGDSTDPLCSYGIIKLAIEKYLFCYSRLYGFDAVVLRLANPYGIRQSPQGQQGAVPIFMWKILHGEPISMWGDGSTIRDFMHVKDAARLCMLATLSECSGVFNVGSGHGISVADLISLISRTLNRRVEIVRQPARKFDVPAIVLDCMRANRCFDWQPQIVLSEGLKEVAEWLIWLSSSSSLEVRAVAGANGYNQNVRGGA